ncbi:hypothetical protein PMAYCL1PPCAC_06728, partial [Pristionchus mayeri]
NGSISVTRMFKHTFFNDEPTTVDKDIFEKTVIEELKSLEQKAEGNNQLDQLRIGPIKKTLGFYV